MFYTQLCLFIVASVISAAEWHITGAPLEDAFHFCCQKENVHLTLVIKSPQNTDSTDKVALQHKIQVKNTIQETEAIHCVWQSRNVVFPPYPHGNMRYLLGYALTKTPKDCCAVRATDSGKTLSDDHASQLLVECQKFVTTPSIPNPKDWRISTTDISAESLRFHCTAEAADFFVSFQRQPKTGAYFDTLLAFTQNKDIFRNCILYWALTTLPQNSLSLASANPEEVTQSYWASCQTGLHLQRVQTGLNFRHACSNMCPDLRIPNPYESA